MNVKHINYIFVIIILAGFSIPTIAYLYNNRAILTPKNTEESFTNDGLIYHIDKCERRNNLIVVNGWASVKDYSRNIIYKTDIYASVGDSWLHIPKTTTRRSDVSRAMKKPNLYDRSGFNSQIRNSLATKFDKKIRITINDGTNKYEINHNCK